jgi:hypothetical protein
MSNEDNRNFYRTLSMVRAVTAYLDVEGFERRCANAKNDQQRYNCGVDLFGRLAIATKQFSMATSCSGGCETDAAMSFEGWWPHEYDDQIESLDRREPVPPGHASVQPRPHGSKYYEGRAAFMAIQSDASCPYLDDSESFKAWNKGYWAASDAIEP